MISDHEGGTTTDDDLLKGDADFANTGSPSPPPLPPRTLSTSSMTPNELNKKSEDSQAKNLMQQVEEDAAEIEASISIKKEKPHVLPRKSSQLTKSVSLGLEAPTVDRSLKPHVTKPLKSPRKKRNHMHSSLRQMYNLGTQVGKTNGLSSLQGVTVSEYPFGNADGDSDSNSSDFEEFIPPRIRKKYVSESHVPMSESLVPQHSPLDRRGSSPFPSSPSSRPNSKEVVAIKKSSPILTRRPTWFTRKMTSPAIMETAEKPDHGATLPNPERVERREGQDQQSKASRKKKARSRSLDARANMSVSSSGNAYSLLDLHTVTMDSDENTGGTVDSSGYARPFEHINSWRKLIGMDDGSAFSGSLPHLADNVSNAINNNNEDDSDTYLDPKEIAERLDKNMPEKVRKRLDTVLSNTALGNTYLQLVSVNPPQFAEMDIHSPNVIAATPVEAHDSKLSKREPSFKEKWANRSLDFIERPDSCLSGYTSDASSTWAADRSDQETEEGELDEKDFNPYDEIKTTNSNTLATNLPFDDAQYGNTGHVDLGAGEDVYSVIDDDLLINRRSETDSLQRPRKKKDSTDTIPPLPKPRVKKSPLTKQDSGIYAKLDEMTDSIPMEVIKDESSDCRRPPTPPPRRHRNISTVTKGSDCDEKGNSYKHLDVPGVSEIQ